MFGKEVDQGCFLEAPPLNALTIWLAKFYLIIMCLGCMAMYAAVLSGANAPAPAPLVIVQKPTPAQLVRAAFKDNKIVIKTDKNNQAI